MYFYFYCEYQAVVKFQGIIFGVVNNSVKFCDLKKPYPLVEICPLYGESENYSFYLSDDFLNNPPPNVTVTDLKGGYFLKIAKTEKNGEFRIIAQEKFRDLQITAFYDNGYKISLETQTGFYGDALDFPVQSALFTRGENANADLVFALFESEKRKILTAYDVKKTAPVFTKEISDWVVTPFGFTTTERVKDIAKHVVCCDYALTDGKITEIKRKVTASDKFDPLKLPDFLTPYAFAEEYACGGEYSVYLSDELKENADKLKGYFGEFIGVTTPPVFRNYKEIGFIRKISERRYSVDYYTFETEKGKINNIIKI